MTTQTTEPPPPPPSLDQRVDAVENRILFLEQSIAALVRKLEQMQREKRGY